MRGVVILCILNFMGYLGHAQSNKVNFRIEGQGSYTTPDHVPFWMRTNQYGSVPLSGASASAIGRISKDYDTTRHQILDWGAAVEGRANGGKGSNATLIEGYGKVKLWIFELKGGRTRDVMGLADTLLTAGNFAISGTALGIPKVQIGIPEFYALPILGRIFAFKGNYAHGWVGYTEVRNRRIPGADTYFHQKSLWGRIGKDDWKFKFYGGFNDNAFWGNERALFSSYIQTDWESYQSVVFGKKWNGSKVGNHVGVIDVRLEYDFKNVLVAAYRQSYYEVGALYHLANIADGLNGLSIINKNIGTKAVKWRKFLFEFVYTKNQAGEPWSKPTKTGNENYLNHYLYTDGWSYKGIGLGLPFITREADARKGQVTREGYHFINNRLYAVHTGFTGSLGRWDGLVKLSYSRNFGTHETKTFVPVSQFSGYAEAHTNLSPDLQIGGIIALDYGKLLYNSGAFLVKASKSF
ncbi:capsule assembly Wzi family protein [Dyadobacter luticola]|uniref:Capsule assembly Wzi family protein n=1 Tax=Dyadobacter luticola TaxID=1979387 RepID=A0A5R9L1E4_9BACT|nr:capsule assembly Wzi family protein [Dyadobacter luticola]TLV02376.1 capsule assembly Wzi family protein [Dyadobacter luticola]